MPGIRQLADALCAALAAFEPGRYSAEDCADLAEQLARTSRTCETASARAAARAAQSGAHRDRGNASASEWLARVAGSTTGGARSALETLEAVEACPDTKEALIAGELSLEQASEIARLPEREAELLDVARQQSLRAQGRSTEAPPRVDGSRGAPFPTTRATGGSALGRRRARPRALRGRVLTGIREALRESPRYRDRPGLARRTACAGGTSPERSARRMRSSACSAALPPPKPAPPI